MRAIPFGIAHRDIIAPFRAIRQEFRQQPDHANDIRSTQVARLADRMHISTEDACEVLNRIIYTQWIAKACAMPLLAHVSRTLALLHKRRIPLAILSDFPPLAKLQHWNIAHYFSVIINSEYTRLKPSAAPFGVLCQRLELPPQSILYVGNNIHYDIVPAHALGYRTAYYHDPLLRLLRRRRRTIIDTRIRDHTFIFSHYRRLYSYIAAHI